VRTGTGTLGAVTKVHLDGSLDIKYESDGLTEFFVPPEWVVGDGAEGWGALLKKKRGRLMHRHFHKMRFFAKDEARGPPGARGADGR
jgi:hypothetical protein